MPPADQLNTFQMRSIHRLQRQARGAVSWQHPYLLSTLLHAFLGLQEFLLLHLHAESSAPTQSAEDMGSGLCVCCLAATRYCTAGPHHGFSACGRLVLCNVACGPVVSARSMLLLGFCRVRAALGVLISCRIHQGPALLIACFRQEAGWHKPSTLAKARCFGTLLVPRFCSS